MAPAASGWTDVVVHFAFGADDNHHVVEIHLVHQDMALIAEEHSVAGPHLNTWSAQELQTAKELLQLVPSPRSVQIGPSRSPTRSALRLRLEPILTVDRRNRSTVPLKAAWLQLDQ